MKRLDKHSLCTQKDKATSNSVRSSFVWHLTHNDPIWIAMTPRCNHVFEIVCFLTLVANREDETIKKQSDPVDYLCHLIDRYEDYTLTLLSRRTDGRTKTHTHPNCWLVSRVIKRYIIFGIFCTKRSSDEGGARGHTSSCDPSLALPSGCLTSMVVSLQHSLWTDNRY